jgi:hypothetical protein
MTSLLLWFAADKKKDIGFKPASVYIASDSRISWPGGVRWEHGKKVFASAVYPEVFGYCGDRFFAALILGQVVSSIDTGYLFEESDGVMARMSKVQQMIRMAWDTYPPCQKETVQILHASREGEGVECSFYYQEHTLTSTKGMRSSEPVVAPAGEISRPLLVRGTGSSSVENSIDEWNRRYKSRHTSRAMFAAFCEAIRSDRDPSSGGAPQLVGLYRIGAGRSFGVVWDGDRYFDGQRTLAMARKDAVGWRNDTFEVVDQGRKRRMSGAARHYREFDF